MFQKIIFLFVLSISLVSCQFTETLVLNEDGSGRMSVEMDLSEMLAFDVGGSEKKDTTLVKMDTIISMRKLLEEKKDSISTLSFSEQKKLESLEDFSINMVMDTEAQQMVFKLFTNFNSINQANDIFNKFSKSSSMSPVLDKKMKGDDKEIENDVIGVNYSYKKRKFIRDAYVKDIEKHQKQVDSMKSTESFLKEMTYTLNYTFPRKIKKVSNPNAQINEDGKSLILKIGFTDYFKNPDVLDLEVELEK